MTQIFKRFAEKQNLSPRAISLTSYTLCHPLTWPSLLCSFKHYAFSKLKVAPCSATCPLNDILGGLCARQFYIRGIPLRGCQAGLVRSWWGRPICSVLLPRGLGRPRCQAARFTLGSSTNMQTIRALSSVAWFQRSLWGWAFLPKCSWHHSYY